MTTTPTCRRSRRRRRGPARTKSTARLRDRPRRGRPVRPATPCPLPAAPPARCCAPCSRRMRGRVVVAALLLLVQQAAVQAGPLLVAYAIDSGVPAFRDHDYGPLIAVGVGYAVCSRRRGAAPVRLHPGGRADQPGRAARPARPDLPARAGAERRLPRALHLGPADLPLDHRRGVAARAARARGCRSSSAWSCRSSTSPLMLLWLDLGLGAIAVASFVPLYLLVRVYRRRAAAAYPARSTAIAAVIVKFAETMNGIRPVQAFRRERANDADFARAQPPPRADERRRAPGDGPLCRRLPARRQHRGRRRSCCGAPTGWRRTDAGARRAGRRGALSAPAVRPDRPARRCSSTPTSRRRLRWRRSRGCWPRRRPCPSRSAPKALPAARRCGHPGRGGRVRRRALRLPDGRRGAARAST